jgi:peptide/nickel transport system permease protein
MPSYLAKRCLIGVLMLLGLSVLVFVLLRLAPGDPVTAYIDPSVPVSPAYLEALRARLGLDQPLPMQYFAWLAAAIRGDLGFSIQRAGVEVVPLLIERMGPTLLLMASGIAIAIAIGVVAGIAGAVWRNSPLDVVLGIGAFLGISSPAYLNSLLGLFLFAVILHWVPAGGMMTPGSPFSVGDVLAHLWLPAILLSITQTASIMRYMRASMLEVLNQDYVRTARAKGVPEFWVVVKHALRNALLPVITLIGSTIGTAIGGAIFIETIFNWPGMGLLMVNAVGSRDYPVIMGATLLIGTFVILVNLLTDLAYAAVDPRIQVA